MTYFLRMYRALERSPRPDIPIGRVSATRPKIARISQSDGSGVIERAQGIGGYRPSGRGCERGDIPEKVERAGPLGPGMMGQAAGVSAFLAKFRPPFSRA